MARAARSRGLSLVRVALWASAVLIVLLSVSLYMRASIAAHILHSARTGKTYNAILVLGASVVRDTPSPAFAARANKAIELYNASSAPFILISGASDRGYNEVETMAKYLLGAGIPVRALVRDESGNSTYESIWRAEHVLGFQSLIIPTQDFHLPRALFIAQVLGVDADGVVVPGGRLFDYVREIPASVRAGYELTWGARI